MFQICVNCNEGQPGYPHPEDCPRPKYHGEPDPDAPAWQEAEKPSVFTRAERDEIARRQADAGILDWFAEEISRREAGLTPRDIPTERS